MARVVDVRVVLTVETDDPKEAIETAEKLYPGAHVTAVYEEGATDGPMRYEVSVCAKPPAGD